MPSRSGKRLLALMTLGVLTMSYSKDLACEVGVHADMDPAEMTMPQDAGVPPEDGRDAGDCSDVMVCVGCGGMTSPGITLVPVIPVHAESLFERGESERDDTPTPLTPPPRA
jgi:hypothetical protein